jgi:hypothetical protein
MKHRFAALTALVVLGACGEEPMGPSASLDVAPAFDVVSNVYTSGSHVTTWDPIFPAAAYDNWGTTVCTSRPLVGLDAGWVNPHNAFVLGGHPWANSYFTAPWINAWSNLTSQGPGGHNWTKYETQVSGNGGFVIRLLADNCSWIYLDGTLVGVQGTDLAANSYGLTLNGSHTLTFVIFDGGGAAGGKFRLETTSNPPPPLNPDLDNDGYPNVDDAFPLDPTEWADSDGDGYGDNSDAFPNDPTRWEPIVDADGDGIADDVDNCSAIANADQTDTDADGQGDACDPDDDNDGLSDADEAAAGTDPLDPDTDDDGVQDGADAFPLSNLSPTCTIRGCDSGVANRILPDGATFNDLIGAAYAAANGNHGAFVNAVTKLADGWKKAGLISGREQGAITSCAARSK